MEVINLFLYNPTYIIVFIVALLFYLFKPKKINSLYGYRTKKSMKDKESWDFSQKYSSKIFLSFSILLLILQLLMYLIFGYKEFIGIVLILIFVIGSIILIYHIENSIN